MIVCPWCGTNYLEFQSNCKNCGGPLQLPESARDSLSAGDVPVPPPAPRPISGKYVWRLLSSDGWAVASFVFFLLGAIFASVGGALTLAIVTAFVGIPFFLMGIAFLGGGGGVLAWRYREAQNIVNVLRTGEATRGEVVEVTENYAVQVNGRHPWIVRYRFQADGRTYEGAVRTLNRPDPQLQVGAPASVLYLPEDPQWSSIYPHP